MAAAAAKDPSPSPESACTEEPDPASGVRPPVTAKTLAASSPARPATLPPPPPAVLGVGLGTILAFGPTIFDCMVRIQNKHI